MATIYTPLAPCTWNCEAFPVVVLERLNFSWEWRFSPGEYTVACLLRSGGSGGTGKNRGFLEAVQRKETVAFFSIEYVGQSGVYCYAIHCEFNYDKTFSFIV